MRTLKDFLEVYEPKAPDEKKFKDKHVTIKFKDRNEVGGKENGDDVFNASNVKTVARKDNRQGYNVGEDEKVYEEADIESMDESELLEFALNLIEKTLTPAEKKKREEIAKAIERENPDMPMAQKMAIATAQAKKVAEEVEDLDELSNNTLGSYVKKATNQAFNKGFAGGANLSRGQEHEKEGERQVNKAVKRVIGVNKAVNKMTKEEVNPAHYDIAGLIEKAKAKGDPKHPAMKHVAALEDIKKYGGALSVQGGHVRSLIKALGEQAEQIDETAKIVAHLQKRYGDNIRKSHVRSAANDFGVGYTGLAHAVRKKLGVVRLEEENDDGWYTHNEMHGKVSKEHWKKGWRYNNLKDKPFYHQPTKTWHASIKEEVEAIDEISNDTMRNYVDKASDARGHRNLPTKKVDNRYAGVRKASDKLAKEEVIDELSKPTMGRYINRAKDSIDMASYRQGAKGSTSGPLEKKLTKRHKGIETAVKKLTKEDIINRAVSKYVPEELKFTPEERMIKRLDGLREDHIDMLMGLFESLNDVNQAKMIESAETEEGRNQLLDFAINNRGA